MNGVFHNKLCVRLSLYFKSKITLYIFPSNFLRDVKDGIHQQKGWSNSGKNKEYDNMDDKLLQDRP